MKRKRLATGLVCVAALSVALAVVSYLSRPPALYRATVLPPLGGGQMGAHAINDHGQVVGIAQTKDGQWRVFLWDRAHGTQDLGPAEGRFDINNAGQVAGAVPDPNGNRQACLWEPGKGWTSLGTLGGKTSHAWAINNRGQIVGTSDTADGHYHAFLWDRAHGMRDLGTLGGADSQGRAINDLGEVFGLADTPTQENQLFLWDPNHGIVAIGPLPPGTSLNDLNNASWTVGEAEGPGQSLRMIGWNRSVGCVDLFPLDHRMFGLALLNDAHQIVYCEEPAERPSWLQRRFLGVSMPCYLWDPNSGTIPLDPYIPAGRQEFFMSVGMNNQGCIVGVVENPSDESHARAVLLEPIWEHWTKQTGRRGRSK